MQIQYEKEAAKHINKMDKPTKQRINIRFVPEEAPLPDEIEAIKRADKSISEYGTISHKSINWE